MIFKKHGRIVLLMVGVMVAIICIVVYVSNGQIRYDAVFGGKPYSESQKKIALNSRRVLSPQISSDATNYSPLR